MALIFAVSACDQPTDKQTVWDASLPWSAKEFHTKNAQDFADAINTATHGTLRINIHPGAVLGLKGPSSLRALGEGIVDMAEMAAFQQVGTEPILGIESLPFLVADQDELAILYEILQPKLDEIFARRGIKLLYMVPWPNQNLYFKREVHSISELAGTKIRTYDRNSSNMVARLGMSPVQLPSSDVTPALASGMIDGAMTSTTTAAAQNFQDFLSHIYRTNHLWISNFMGVNLGAYNALPATIQNQLTQIARDMQPGFWQVSSADDLAKLKILEAGGITTIEPSAEMMAEMRALARPMWREFADAVPGAREVLKTYLARTGKEPLE